MPVLLGTRRALMGGVSTLSVVVVPPASATGPLSFTAPASGSPSQGVPDNFGVTFAGGYTTAYITLARAGTEETVFARDVVTTAFPWSLLTPQSSGSYTVRAYDALIGGTLIGESAPFTVAASSLTSVPLASSLSWSALGDSTIAIGMAANSPSHTTIDLGTRVVQMAAYRLGVPLDVWPSYQGQTTAGGQGQNGVGGLIDGIVGDVTGAGTGTGSSAVPGYASRMSRVLMRRPSILFLQATVNDTGSGVTAATSIANLTAVANRALLAGCRVHFLLERPWDTANSTQKQTRADKNTGLVNFANATTGCSYTDLSPVYGTTYNATSWTTLDANLISGFHPTNKGGMAEAEYLASDLVTKGIVSSTVNYARDSIFASNDSAIFSTPTFAGTNAGVVFSNGVTGSAPNGIRNGAGPGASLSSAVCSIESNADTSGQMLKIDITPQTAAASTALHNFSFNHIAASNSGLTGYVGWVEEMCEIEVSSDPDGIVSGIQHDAQINNVSRQSCGYTQADTTSAGYWPAQGSARKFWAVNRVYIDGRSTSLNINTKIETKPSDKSSVATVRIRRMAVRKLGLDLHEKNWAPRAASLAGNGSPASGNIPVRATLATGGVAPTGMRFFRSLGASTQTWVADVVLTPGATTVDYVYTGLTASTAYTLLAVPILNGGVLGADYGRTSQEASWSPPLVVTAA